MDRLTKTKIDVEKFSKKTKSRLTHEYFEMAKLNNKLFEYENFMENFDFDNLEDLEHYVQEIHNHYEEVKNKGTCGLCHYLDNEQLDLFKKENAELETKLAEKDELLEDYRQLIGELREELGNVDCEYKTKIFTLKRTLVDECKEHRDFCRIADKKVKGLEQQLKEERKKVVQEIRDLAGDYFEMPYCEECGNTDYNDVVLMGKDLTEILDQIEKGGNNGNK